MCLFIIQRIHNSCTSLRPYRLSLSLSLSLSPRAPLPVPAPCPPAVPFAVDPLPPYPMPVLRDCTFALFHNLEFMKRKQVTVSTRFIVHLTLFYFARLTRTRAVVRHVRSACMSSLPPLPSLPPVPVLPPPSPANRSLSAAAAALLVSLRARPP